MMPSLVSEKTIDLNGENLTNGLRVLAKIILREYTETGSDGEKNVNKFYKDIRNN